MTVAPEVHDGMRSRSRSMSTNRGRAKFRVWSSAMKALLDDHAGTRPEHELLPGALVQGRSLAHAPGSG